MKPSETVPKLGHNQPRFDESDRLLARALELIPLGSQTFSKSHQQFVRGAMPQMLERGRGARVEDPDGNSYIDYVLGLLPIVLGYGDPDVDAAIRAQLEKGITFSLPSPLEADLAEKLVQLIPCAEKVRFGKNGSDATSAAIRIARAHTGRDKVALCGYHGWHDWYIGATSRHLGVPQAVRELSFAFPFNQAERLTDLLRKDPDGFAAVILEPCGAAEPGEGFLQELRSITERHGIVLVFDEIVTGFRINLGGAQAEYGVTPDLACFGKAMGNGMPISAVVGRAEIMNVVEDIFFSGTFGGEALSLAASLATIGKLERAQAVPRMRACGRRLIEAGNRLVHRHGLESVIEIGGADWWPRWKMKRLPIEANLFNSLLRQETAAAGLLTLSTFNLCLAHEDAAIEAETLTALDRALDALGAALKSGEPARHLRGEPIRPTFSVRPA